MKEFMRIEDAIQKRSRNCIIKNVRTNFEIKVDNGGDFSFKCSFVAGEYFRKEWKIIPEELVVLRPEEIFNRELKGVELSVVKTINYGKECLEAGEEKQWRNHKELRDLAEKLRDVFADHKNAVLSPFDLWNEFNEALKNLKPLEK